jgi:ketosteroid isomerase-like protein
MQRDDMLAKVEAAYQARRSGDFAVLQDLVAPNARFSLAGDQTLLAAMPSAGEITVHEAARRLFDTIELRELERVDAVAEGNRVAILWKTTAVGTDRQPFETLMFDLWEFDASGKIAKGTQFVDTARFIEAMRARADA